MSEANLEGIDTLITHLRQALSDEDWDELAKLNQLVKPTIEPLMAALEAGDVEAEPVRERLQTLQAFCDTANTTARKARDQAKQALDGVNQNRQAARAYQKVLSNPQK